MKHKNFNESSYSWIWSWFKRKPFLKVKKRVTWEMLVVGIVSDQDDAGILEIADQYSIPSSVANVAK